MNRRTLSTMALALVTTVALTACGASSEDDPAAAATRHTAADVTFAQGMVPHHGQAVQMAALAVDRASSAEVKKLAAAIGEDQRPEINQLTAMLGRWQEPVAAADPTAHAGHGAAGMMSDSDMTSLTKARGTEFDRRFLTLLIAHHEGAVRMAATELRDGRDPEALGLAQKITDSQRAEIARMRQLLAG